MTDSLTGFPVPSATVSVTDSQNVTQGALTDNNGGFTISGIGSGTFNGSITKVGYTARTFSGTMVSDHTLTLNAALKPHPSSNNQYCCQRNNDEFSDHHLDNRPVSGQPR